MNIVAYQRGGYDPYVKTSEGASRNLVEVVAELLQDMDGPGNVLARFNVQNNYVGGFVNTRPLNEWMFDDYANDLVLQALVVPSASDLGIDVEKYQVFAKTLLTAQDPLGTTDVMETRLINLSDDSVVPGSQASAPLTTGDAEQAIYSDWFEVPTNARFFLDFRKVNDNSTSSAAARRQSLLVRIVRR